MDNRRRSVGSFRRDAGLRFPPLVNSTIVPCAFCGQDFSRPDRPRSDEHAWARWLSEYLPDPEAGFQHIVQRSESGELMLSWHSDTLDVVTAKVCKPCNEGWMNDLETRARPYLVSLIQGRGRTLYREGQTALAAWAMKTALALQIATPESEPFPENHYRELAGLKTTPPSRTQVFLAAFQGPQHAHVGSKHIEMEQASGDKHDGYLSTFFLGRALFQVFGHTHPTEEVVLSKRGVHSDASVQIWPIQQEPISWPPTVVVNERSFPYFASGPSLVAE